MTTTTFDQGKFDKVFGKVFSDIGGAIGVLMAYLGDQVGIYAALEKSGPATSAELGKATGLDERYLREWLSANAAAEYVDYDIDTEKFSLSPEQAALFAHEGEPTCMQGFFEAIVSQYASHETAVETFRSGKPRPWSEHPANCFCGVDRFFRPGYGAALVQNWIPALDGIDAKLKAGARIADIGCGLGSSAILMASHYRDCDVHGFDFHGPSIVEARSRTEAKGLDNLEFYEAAADQIPLDGYDLVCIFDALHDMGDPVGAATRIRQSLARGGSFMIVEPLAGDNLADNLHLLGAVFYGFSTTICVPTSRAQNGALQLGAQAGQKRIAHVLEQAGFTSVRRVAETATNMVLEARV